MTPGMNTRRAAVVLLAISAAAGLAWWAALLARPDLGAVFLPRSVPQDVIRTFALADFVVYFAFPAAAAAGLRRDARWAVPVLWLYSGGALYAALWGWGTVLATGEGLLGAALMTPPAVLMPWLGAKLRT